MQNQKGISTLVGVVIIIAVAVILFGGIFAYQYFATLKANNQPQVQNQQQAINQQTNNNQPADLTAGWKTYNETDFGFSFKYPNTWIADDNLTLNTCCLNVSNYDPIKKQSQFLEKGEIEIQIADYKKSALTTLKDFVSAMTYMESNIKATSVKEVNIAGIQGIYSNLNGDQYYLPKSPTEGISITIFNHPESKNGFEAIIDQVLSTFKFTR